MTDRILLTNHTVYDANGKSVHCACKGFCVHCDSEFNHRKGVLRCYEWDRFRRATGRGARACWIRPKDSKDAIWCFGTLVNVHAYKPPLRKWSSARQRRLAAAANIARERT